MISGPVSLPVTALAAVAEQHDCGRLHPTLLFEPVWLPAAERARADDQAWEGLVEAGVVDGVGRLDVDFLDWLPLLSNPSLEYYGWLFRDDTTWSVLAAARGLQGVLAVRRGDRVTLRRTRHGRLAETLARQLPKLAPGGGTPRSVRVADLASAGVTGATDRGMPSDVAEIAKAVQRPVSGGGQLYVAERDEHGRRGRLPEPLCYVDTDRGRYLNYTTGSGANAEVHLAPGSAAAIVATLARLRTVLTWPAS